jgi:hypothetical protein
MRVLSVLLLMSAPFGAVAHHSPAAFDQTAFVVIEGTVSEFTWGNPHVYLAVETTGPGGERYVQRVEAGPASQLSPRGMTPQLLRPGDTVTVRANPNRRGAGHVVLGVELTTADGSSFPLHARTLRALGATGEMATSIEGTWVPEPESYLRLAAEMRDWPITERAREIRAGDRSGMLAIQAACIPPGPPALMAGSVLITVAVDDDRVIFDIDGSELRRTVHVGAEHPVDVEPSLFGHSIGRWDGMTLLVDTLGFSPHAEGMGFSFPSSEAKHIVERFSLSDDHRQLDYEITIDDDMYLTEAVTYRTRWDYRPEQVGSDAPCDPSVARRFLEEESGP